MVFVLANVETERLKFGRLYKRKVLTGWGGECDSSADSQTSFKPFSHYFYIFLIILYKLSQLDEQIQEEIFPFALLIVFTIQIEIPLREPLLVYLSNVPSFLCFSIIQNSSADSQTNFTSFLWFTILSNNFFSSTI